ncbi:MAG: hypothetical protein ACFB21_05280 [Opitutales bacterium]
MGLNKFVLTGVDMLCYESVNGRSWNRVAIDGDWRRMAVMDAACSEDTVVLLVGGQPEWAGDNRRILFSNKLGDFKVHRFEGKRQRLNGEGEMLEDREQKRRDDLHRLDTIVYGNNRFLATGGQPAHGNKVWTRSRSGRDWEQDLNYWKSWNIGQVRTLVHGGDRFLGIGDFKRISVTEDGETWKFNRDKDRPAWLSAAYGNGIFVAGGLHGLHGISRDGLTWENLEEGEIGHHLNAMITTGGGFIGLGTQVAYFSDNGRSWRVENIEPRLRQVAYGNGVFVGFDVASRKLMRSTDALTWEEIELDTEQPSFTSVRFL